MEGKVRSVSVCTTTKDLETWISKHEFLKEKNTNT